MNLHIDQTYIRVEREGVFKWCGSNGELIPQEHTLDIQSLSWFPHTIFAISMRDSIKHISPLDTNSVLHEALFNLLSEVVDPQNVAIREDLRMLWTERVEGKLISRKISYVLVKNEEDAFLLAMKYR